MNAVRLSLAAALLLVAWRTAAVANPLRAVALSGQSVPNATDLAFSTFDMPRLTNRGEVIFAARMVDSHLETTNALMSEVGGNAPADGTSV
jgi:hypothetical protein